MIRERNTWIFAFNPNNKLNNSISGKWLIFGKKEYLHLLFHKINTLVDKGEIFQAKISKFPLKNQTHVICVYGDNTTKEKTWKELQNLGCKRKIWKYNALN